jgi:lipoprotein signal peptidase
MVLQTAAPTRPPHPHLPDPPRPGPAPGRRQGLLAVAVLVGVVVLDQGTKWWAWRHVYAVINAGSTWFLGGTVSGWYSDGLRGALLDLGSAEALTLGAFLLLRRPRPPRLLVPALLMIGGWGSNLLDRVGLHLLTAPGRGRGAVDFLPLGRFYYNFADVVIVLGTALFLVAAVRLAWRSRRRRTDGGPLPAARPWRAATRWALVAALTPVLLGTATTLTADGHPTVADAPAVDAGSWPR